MVGEQNGIDLSKKVGLPSLRMVARHIADYLASSIGYVVEHSRAASQVDSRSSGGNLYDLRMLTDDHGNFPSTWLKSASACLET